MKTFQEVTEWDPEYCVPNHVYFLNDSKEKMYGYINSKGIIQNFTKPYKFYSKGRKFKEVPDVWGFRIEEEEPEVAVGKEYRVPGSRGAIYTVTDDNGAWSCTCPASKWQKGECKHIVQLKTVASS